MMSHFLPPKDFELFEEHLNFPEKTFSYDFQGSKIQIYGDIDEESGVVRSVRFTCAFSGAPLDLLNFLISRYIGVSVENFFQISFVAGLKEFAEQKENSSNILKHFPVDEFLKLFFAWHRYLHWRGHIPSSEDDICTCLGLGSNAFKIAFEAENIHQKGDFAEKAGIGSKCGSCLEANKGGFRIPTVKLIRSYRTQYRQDPLWEFMPNSRFVSKTNPLSWVDISLSERIEKLDENFLAPLLEGLPAMKEDLKLAHITEKEIYFVCQLEKENELATEVISLMESLVSSLIEGDVKLSFLFPQDLK